MAGMLPRSHPPLGRLAAAWIVSLVAGSAQELPDPVFEFRAAWIATVYNIDWPSRPGLPASSQQGELRRLLDLAADAQLNAVILQVRPAGDALYATAREPWSRVLTGTEGKDPGYDPLAFAIREAHVRGLELHAWFNPFRPALKADDPHPRNHVTFKRPEAVRLYRGKPWLDPGDAWVRDYTIDLVADVARRYDVDGIHIDDYFYPYPPVGEPCRFPDDPTFASYQRDGGRLSREEWRRANIDGFVRGLGAAVRKANPGVKFGVSPFGIWRPGVPTGIEARLDSFAHIYADSRTWLREGWVDYLSPQLYWRIEPRAQSFSALLGWWDEQNIQRRHLWPGIATSRIDSSEDPGRPASEIVGQVAATRRITRNSLPGHVHWSMKALATDRGGIRGRLGAVYAEKALVPPTPWLRSAVPDAPRLRVATAERVVEWPPDRAARRWAVQVLQNGKWTLLAVLPGETGRFAPPAGATAIAVRGIARNGVPGRPAAHAL